MGQSLSTCIGYLLMYYLKLSEMAQDIWKGKRENKKGKYYNNEILLKDEEHHASN